MVGKGICAVGDNSDGVQADSLLVYNNSGDLLATLPILGDPAFEHEGSGTISWSNPVDQFISDCFLERHFTGGIVALGKVNNSASLPSSWSPGLRIFPDYDLLTGTKIPPVTPNIIDVRIVRQLVQADFPSRRQYPGN
jgi:hypothetical protein